MSKIDVNTKKIYRLVDKAELSYIKHDSDCQRVYDAVKLLVEDDVLEDTSYVFRQTDGIVLVIGEDNIPVEYIVQCFVRKKKKLTRENLKLISI